MDTPDFREDDDVRFRGFENDEIDDWIKRLHVGLDDEALKSLKDLPPFNFVVAGNTGAGKSALINVVFGKTLTKEGIGKTQTPGIDKITSPPMPFSLYDTRGLEVQESAQTIRELNELVGGLRRSEN